MRIKTKRVKPQRLKEGETWGHYILPVHTEICTLTAFPFIAFKFGNVQSVTFCFFPRLNLNSLDLDSKKKYI